MGYGKGKGGGGYGKGKGGGYGKGKGGGERVLAKIEARWPTLKGCIGSKETRKRLDEVMVEA